MSEAPSVASVNDLEWSHCTTGSPPPAHIDASGHACMHARARAKTHRHVSRESAAKIC